MKKIPVVFGVFLYFLAIFGCYMPPVRDAKESNSDKQVNVADLPENDNPHGYSENFKQQSAGVWMYCLGQIMPRHEQCWLENTNEFTVQIREVENMIHYPDMTRGIYQLEPGAKKLKRPVNHSYYISTTEGKIIGFLNGL